MNVRFVAYPRLTDDLPLFGRGFTLCIYLSKSYRPKGGEPKAEAKGVLTKFVVDDSLSFLNEQEIEKLIISFTSSTKEQNDILKKYRDICAILIDAKKDNIVWNWLLDDPYSNFPILKKRYKSLRTNKRE